MNKLSFLLILSAIALVSFQSDQACRRQGIRGKVSLVAGNQMPSPDRPPGGTNTGFKTTLYIYQLTNTGQVMQNGAFYESISTPLVKAVETAEDGSFKVKLKPGWYSLFVKKGDLFYSNIYDEKGNIHPVEVKKGEWTDENFKADYDAAY